jgi:hypothetical protein
MLKRVKVTLFINKQVRKYYGKKYYRSATSGAGGGTQERFLVSQARANKKRASESKAGIIAGKETEIVQESVETLKEG